MSLGQVSLKSEMKISILNEQGVKADDQLEGARSRGHGHGGAKQALRVAAKNVQGLALMVDSDIDAGEIPTDPLDVARYAKDVISRAVNILVSLAQHHENLQISALGEASAYERLVASLKKDVDAEVAKIAALASAIANGSVVVEDGLSLAPGAAPRERRSGARPGNGIAAQRRAEEAETHVNDKLSASVGSAGEDSPVEANFDEAPRKARGHAKNA